MSSKKDAQPKKKQTTRFDNEKLFSYFAGSLVNVIVKDITTQGEKSNTANLTIVGILLDIDDQYVYLGSEDQVVTGVNKDSISLIILDAANPDKDNDEFDIPKGSIQQ